MDDVCRTCNDEGRPRGCPRCFKVKKKRRRYFPPKSKLTEEQKHQLKVQEIRRLWREANMEEWRGNRRKYMELIKVIKRKENLLHR